MKNPFILFGIPVFAFLLSTSILSAQTALSLEEALQQTAANNTQLKVAELAHAAAEQEVEKMRSIYLPQVEASATGTLTNFPLNAFGTRLQQGAITQMDFLPEDLNDPASIANLQTQITVQQPLLNADASAMKKAVEAQSRAVQYQKRRTESSLVYQVKQAYLQLQLTYAMRKVWQKAQSTANANLKLVNDNIEAGYAQQADRLSVEVRQNEIEARLIQIDHQIQDISNQLAFLMGRELGAVFQPSDSLVYQKGTGLLTQPFSLNRSDFQAMEQQVEATGFMADAARKSSLPRLNAFGSYGLNNTFDFEEAQHGYLVGLQASWQIYNGNTNRSETRKRKIELEKTRQELQQMINREQLAFEMTKRKLLNAQTQIELAKKSIEQAEEALRVKTNRFAEGLELTSEVLRAETTLAQQEMKYVQAVFQYQLALSELSWMLENE